MDQVCLKMHEFVSGNHFHDSRGDHMYMHLMMAVQFHETTSCEDELRE